ncbi:glycosyltransferase involved in cell wall biosynthesis [Paraburkholderia sp. GAS448]
MNPRMRCLRTRSYGTGASALGKLWNDSALAADLGVSARARFKENFTAKKMVDSYVDLYQRLILSAD